MRFGCGLALLAASAAIMSGAQARSPAAPSPADPIAERELREFAHCMVLGDPIVTRRILGSEPGSEGEAAGLASFSTNSNRCVKGALLGPAKLRGNRIWFRAALFEADYKLRFGKVAPQPATPLIAPKQATVVQGKMGAERAQQLQYLYAIAACTVGRQVDPVRALILAEPGSPEETAALQAVLPIVGSCVPSGASVGITRPLLRATLAEMLYRWSAMQATANAAAAG